MQYKYVLSPKAALSIFSSSRTACEQVYTGKYFHLTFTFTLLHLVRLVKLQAYQFMSQGDWRGAVPLCLRMTCRYRQARDFVHPVTWYRKKKKLFNSKSRILT